MIQATTKGLAIEVIAAPEQLVWPPPLAALGGFPALEVWLAFVQKIYGFGPIRLAAWEGNQLSGLLSLCHVKHPLFGHYLTTAPYASYGGFAYSTVSARDALLAQARALAGDSGADYVNVRFPAGQEVPPPGWIQNSIYATYQVELEPESERMLGRYSSDHRNHIRKSLRKGFSIRFGRTELLDDAYEALALSMHELGSPYHSKLYLRGMAEALGESLEFAVLYGPAGELAGAGVFITQGSMVTNLHANILRRYRSDYAGEYLYWSVIVHYAERGRALFDLGRSLIGSGNEIFKMKWRPRAQVLAYWYSLRKGTTLPELNQKNPRYRLAIAAWKRLPGFITRRLGPFLIRGLA